MFIKLKKEGFLEERYINLDKVEQLYSHNPITSDMEYYVIVAGVEVKLHKSSYDIIASKIEEKNNEKRK